jgi:hypothetical protein
MNVNTIELNLILNKIINLDFNNKNVNQYLSKIENLNDILIANDIKYTCIDSRDSFLIDLAREENFKRIEHAYYVHSLS